ncbi:hypothetical protein D9M69_361010 [compost metagenome]
MRRTLIGLATLGLLAGCYIWITGMRVSFTPSYTTSEVKLYATETDANARTDDFIVLPIRAKCYLTKIGGKHNTKRVRCENPEVEGWIRAFDKFEPPLGR